MSEAKNKRRSLVTGRVTSDKMDKTIKVLSYRLMKHPKYKKYIRKKSVFTVHDADNTAKKGDMVQIAGCRPLSKTKRWRLKAVVEDKEGARRQDSHSASAAAAAEDKKEKA